MIEAISLSKNFGALKAVDNINFSVQTGEVLGFLGPNGAGKSTTMKLITGFMRPSSGRVLVNGQDSQKKPQRVRRQLGYLPEGAPAYEDMRVCDFLDFIAQARGIQKTDRRSAIGASVERLSIAKVMDKPVHTLSKGFKRRVGIAQALLHDPSVLILDEPTDGLDPNQKHQVRELLRGLSSDKTVIISTHILEEVEAVCQRALIIADGQVKADATPNELLQRSNYRGAISIELENAALHHALFQAIEGVSRLIPSLHNPQQFTLLANSGENLYPKVQQLLSEKQLQPLSLSIDRGRLDDVFRQVTLGNSAVEVVL